VKESIRSIKESTQKSLFKKHPISARIYDSEEMKRIVDLKMEGYKLGYDPTSFLHESYAQRKIFGSTKLFEDSVNKLWQEINGMVEKLVEEGAKDKDFGGGWGLSHNFDLPEKEDMWEKLESDIRRRDEQWNRRFGPS
jgi:hypothetical protein